MLVRLLHHWLVLQLVFAEEVLVAHAEAGEEDGLYCTFGVVTRDCASYFTKVPFCR